MREDGRREIVNIACAGKQPDGTWLRLLDQPEFVSTPA